MMTFLLTLLLTFCLVMLALVLFWKFGSPVYRVKRENIVALLELVVSGQATESDWEVFCAVPVRHDPDLARIQKMCMAIAEREYLGGQGMLFTRAGTEELFLLLQSLKADIDKPADGADR